MSDFWQGYIVGVLVLAFVQVVLVVLKHNGGKDE